EPRKSRVSEFGVHFEKLLRTLTVIYYSLSESSACEFGLDNFCKRHLSSISCLMSTRMAPRDIFYDWKKRKQMKTIVEEQVFVIGEKTKNPNQKIGAKSKIRQKKIKQMGLLQKWVNVQPIFSDQNHPFSQQSRKKGNPIISGITSTIEDEDDGKIRATIISTITKGTFKDEIDEVVRIKLTVKESIDIQDPTASISSVHLSNKKDKMKSAILNIEVYAQTVKK
ncbi:hypothetical protein MKW98_008603, partial [Papaver atlanticum]